MDQQKRINKVLDAVEARVQKEIGTLLGTDFTLIGGDRSLVSKEAVFDNLQGKQICAQMDITGEITGKGCLLIGIKDGIRLGGTLIMLPSAELEEVIGREEYSEELEDSYGEIANIIAGSFTKDFEELYPKSCRFVRKEQEVLIPAKVDIESDSPIANQTYYHVEFTMVLDGRQMGNIVMLMPAATFGLQEQEEVGTSNGASNEPEVVVNKEVLEEGVGAQQNIEQPVVTEQSSNQPKNSDVGPKFDVEKHKKKVNRLLTECQKRIEKEVATLLGTDFSLSDSENRLLSKEEFFLDHVVDRQILTDMEVAGEVQGKSYLVVSVKDAIRLGGILIMLPPSELESVVQAEDFSEDSRDAYGEIANIISGVYTAVFEEQYNQKLRFIRKEMRDIAPAKVDTQSEQPIPDQSYYTSSMSIEVDGKLFGKMQMLFPAEMLRLDAPKEEIEQETVSDIDQGTPVANDNLTAENEQSTRSSKAGNSEKSGAVETSQLDIAKHKNRVDKILATCRDKMADEVSALLGTPVKLSNLENLIVSKEEFFFEQVSGKQVLANLDVVGELEGKSYLSVGIRDAIRIGGTLIMLPSAELDSVVTEENFGEDVQDAYGEIANIMAGVYTSVFEDQYTKRIRFVKTDLQQVAPMKVDIGAEQPIPDQDYYLSRMDLIMGDLELGKVSMLFPADLLRLCGLRSDSSVSVEDKVPSSQQIHADQEKISKEHAQRAEENDLKAIDILVVGDDEAEVEKIAGVLGHSGYSVKKLTFKDNLHNYIPGKLKAIYMVMKDVNEQAFGVAIKVSSSCSVPLIAAGPAWTKTKVIKAVKYGVQDILLTPASKEDIEENVHNNLLELAA